MKMNAPTTTQGEGGALSEPGTYHVIINKVIEGESSTGKAIDGITIEVEVMAGTTSGMEGKTRKESLFVPSMKDEEREAQTGQPSMARKKLAALYIATNQMTPDQLGQPIDVDDMAMIGEQCVIKFDRQMEQDGEGKYTVETKYIQISYSDIFHVDDPQIAAVPKNADALGLIDKSHRHPEQWFAWKKRRAATLQRQAVGAGASTKADDLFD